MACNTKLIRVLFEIQWVGMELPKYLKGNFNKENVVENELEVEK